MLCVWGSHETGVSCLAWVHFPRHLILFVQILKQTNEKSKNQPGTSLLRSVLARDAPSSSDHHCGGSGYKTWAVVSTLTESGLSWRLFLSLLPGRSFSGAELLLRTLDMFGRRTGVINMNIRNATFRRSLRCGDILGGRRWRMRHTFICKYATYMYLLF